MFVLGRKLHKILHQNISLSIFSLSGFKAMVYGGICDHSAESLPSLISTSAARPCGIKFTTEFTKTMPVFVGMMLKLYFFDKKTQVFSMKGHSPPSPPLLPSLEIRAKGDASFSASMLELIDITPCVKAGDPFWTQLVPQPLRSVRGNKICYLRTGWKRRPKLRPR